MVTIGNSTLPGTITTIESAASIGSGVGSPGTPVILGQAYLSSGSADADTAYRINRSKRARDLFGPADKSQLTTAVQDALVDGARPVYAIATPETSVSGEDLSGESGQGATLANAPVQEVADDITFTINSTTKTTVLYYQGDPSNGSPGTDEVLLNPVTGKFYADESLGSAGDSVDYTYVDYTNSFDEVTNYQISSNVYLRDVVDFVAPISEKTSVVNSARDKVDSMESNGWLGIALAGAGKPYIADTGSYTNPYDNSRVQLMYPSRDPNGRTKIGGYVGTRAEIGISTSPIFNRVGTATELLESLSITQQENLVNNNVIPLEERSGGARIIEDLTTVTDSNSQEAAWKQGLSRLVTDFVVEQTDAIANGYVGEFNNTGVMNSVRGDIAEALDAMLESNSLQAYSLLVERVDSTTITVDVGINTADPLRNIELNIDAGNVRNGVSSA